MKIAVYYKTDYSKKRHRDYDVDYLQIFPEEHQFPYYSFMNYHKLELSEIPQSLFCSVGIDTLDDRCEVLNIFYNHEKSIEELYIINKNKNTNFTKPIFYVLKFGLENQNRYFPENKHYSIKCSKLRFDDSVKKHFFLCLCTDIKCRHSININQQLTCIINDPDESDEQLKLKILNYYKDVELADLYREKIIIEINDIKNKKFENIIKNRYGKYSDEILEILSKYEHVNIYDDYNIDQMIKKKCG